MMVLMNEFIKLGYINKSTDTFVDMETDADLQGCDTSLDYAMDSTHCDRTDMLGHDLSKKFKVTKRPPAGRAAQQVTMKGKTDIIGEVCFNNSNQVISTSMYLRLKLSSRDICISKILDELQYMRLRIQVGGMDIITIPSLTLNFLILEKLQEIGRSKDRGINIFNLREWLQYRSPDEVALTIHEYGDKRCICRYFAGNLDDTYLDIPLLFDFFGYGMNLKMLAFHEVKVIFTLATDKDIPLINDISIYPEYYHLDIASDDGRSQYHAIMKCEPDIHPCVPSRTLQCYGSVVTKLLYVLIRTEQSKPDHDHDICDLPEIESVIMVHNLSTVVDLDTNMFYIADYDKNIRLYVISPHRDQDMRNWINVANEFKGDGEGIKGGHMDFLPVSVDKFIIKLSNWSPWITVETYLISQNMYHTISGMGTLRYSS